jgi:organic radical activating enzyme
MCCLLSHEETYGGRSYRTQENSLFLTEDPYNLEFQEAQSAGFPKFLRSDLKETPLKPAHFDLRFDNLCNLKCIICSGYASSQIERDLVHMGWTGETLIERLPNRFANSARWTDSEILFEELVEISSDVRFIQLAGGEPFLSQLALRWLDELQKSGRSKAVSMMVYTNFLKFDEKLIEQLASFKRVHLHLSIDSVGKTYEYVCLPGKWETIESNAERLSAELKARLSNTTVSLNVTIAVASAFTVCDTFEWAYGHEFNVNLNTASYPDYIATKYLPEQPELYGDYVAQLGYWLQETRYAAGDIPPLGWFGRQIINLDGEHYAIARRIGGAVENVSEHSEGFMISGWAADHKKKTDQPRRSSR